MKKQNKGSNKKLKVLLKALGFITLAIFFAPCLAGILNIGNLFGMSAGAILLICGFQGDKIKALIKKLCEKKLGKTVFIIFTAALSVFAVAFTVTFGYVAANSRISRHKLLEKSLQPTVIVLGCQVRGTEPSRQLYQRIETAEYMLQNSECFAILSGGQGEDEDISEARCMADILKSNGISENRLYLEDTSVSTKTNLQNSLKIIEKNGLSKNVCIVSSDYHVGRAKLMAKRMSFECVTGAPARTNYIDYPTFAVRDVFAIWYMVLFGI